MVQGHGVYDMPIGWQRKTKKNNRIYQTWKGMFRRCYSEKLHKDHPTYKNCTVCERWLLLSNFVEDYKLINGYDEDKFLKGELCLDKDIKSNGKNKEYSLENCLWVSKSENTKQANKTRDNSYLQGENHPMYGRTGEENPNSIKIVQYDKQGNFIKVWNSSTDVQRELGINNSHILECCKWHECGCNKEEWFKVRKNYPRKSAGGFIWKYYKK